jgi:hypothetical protein
LVDRVRARTEELLRRTGIDTDLDPE